MVDSGDFDEMDWEAAEPRPNTLKINAIDLQPGDAWLGEAEGVYLRVKEVLIGYAIPTIPWTGGRSAAPVKLRPVIISGTFHMADGTKLKGQWTLQEDQPLEVRR